MTCQVVFPDDFSASSIACEGEKIFLAGTELWEAHAQGRVLMFSRCNAEYLALTNTSSSRDAIEASCFLVSRLAQGFDTSTSFPSSCHRHHCHRRRRRPFTGYHRPILDQEASAIEVTAPHS